MSKGKNMTIKIVVAVAVFLNVAIIAVGYMRSSKEKSAAVKISGVIENSVTSAFVEVLRSHDQNGNMVELNGSTSVSTYSGGEASHGLNSLCENACPITFKEGDGLELTP